MSTTSAAPRVLVTRPLAQARRTADRLTALGYQPVLAPMLRVEPILPPPALDLGSVDAILVTSRNGLDALATITTARGIPLMTVGARTAEAAKACGFKTILAAEGNAASLAQLANDRLGQRGGTVLHVRGRDVSTPLAPLLDAGITLRDAILYEAIQARSLPKAALAQPLDAALVYSARTAEALVGAARRSALDLTKIPVIGISPAALEPLIEAPAPRIAASAPTEEAMLAALRARLPFETKN